MDRLRPRFKSHEQSRTKRSATDLYDAADFSDFPPPVTRKKGCGSSGSRGEFRLPWGPSLGKKAHGTQSVPWLPAALASGYFHSQSLVWVLPSGSTSYSNTAATGLRRESFGDAVLKYRAPR